MCALARPGLPLRGMPPADSAPGAGAERKHAAVYASLHRGEERPPLDEQVVRLLPRLADQGYQADQARLYGDVDGPLTGPRRRQLRLLATVRRHRLSGSIAFTTTEPDDRAFLTAIAGTYGFTYAEAMAHTTLSVEWTTSRRPGSAG
jgi:hypothetical protein